MSVTEKERAETAAKEELARLRKRITAMAASKDELQTKFEAVSLELTVLQHELKTGSPPRVFDAPSAIQSSTVIRPEATRVTGCPPLFSSPNLAKSPEPRKSLLSE